MAPNNRTFTAADDSASSIGDDKVWSTLFQFLTNHIIALNFLI